MKLYSYLKFKGHIEEKNCNYKYFRYIIYFKIQTKEVSLNNVNMFWLLHNSIQSKVYIYNISHSYTIII